MVILTTVITLTRGKEPPPGCREIVMQLEEECEPREVLDCGDRGECDIVARKQCHIVIRSQWNPVIHTSCTASLSDDQCSSRLI